MVSRREHIGSIAATIAMSGCFAPGGPKQRNLSLRNITIQQSESNGFEISTRTYFSVRNWDPKDAFHDISIVGFTAEGEIVCRHPVELGEDTSSKTEQEIYINCQTLPEYLTTTIDQSSCESTIYRIYRVIREDSNYSDDYVGLRRCGDDVTHIPE